MCVSSYFAISAYQHANTAQQRLYTSLVREAAAIRRARDVGYRSQVWSRLTSARALGTSNLDVFELRQEAVAAMGDFVGLEPIQRDDFTSDLVLTVETLRGYITAPQQVIALSNCGTSRHRFSNPLPRPVFGETAREASSF